MRYGINFGAPPIPPEMRRGFKTRCRPNPSEPTRVYMLVGICTDTTERDSMIIQATNGTRRLWVIHIQPTPHNPIHRYGIYSG